MDIVLGTPVKDFGMVCGDNQICQVLSQREDLF